MTPKFQRGDRVKISALGLSKALYPRRMDRRGMVVGRGLEYPNTVRVKWDGARVAEDLSEEFVELVR